MIITLPLTSTTTTAQQCSPDLYSLFFKQCCVSEALRLRRVSTLIFLFIFYCLLLTSSSSSLKHLCCMVIIINIFLLLLFSVRSLLLQKTRLLGNSPQTVGFIAQLVSARFVIERLSFNTGRSGRRIFVVVVLSPALTAKFLCLLLQWQEKDPGHHSVWACSYTHMRAHTHTHTHTHIHTHTSTHTLIYTHTYIQSADGSFHLNTLM